MVVTEARPHGRLATPLQVFAILLLTLPWCGQCGGGRETLWVVGYRPGMLNYATILESEWYSPPDHPGQPLWLL